METASWQRLVLASAAASCIVLACDCGTGARTAGPRWASVGHRCATDAPATSLSPAARDSLPAADVLHNQQDRWAQRARTVPGGWGGFFLDNGVPTIYLTDTTQRLQALAALNQPGLDGLFLGPDVRARKGRWDFAQLVDWYRYLTPRLGLVALVSAGIDEAANRIAYSVTGDSAIPQLEARLAALHVPCFLVAVELVTGSPRVAVTPQR